MLALGTSFVPISSKIHVINKSLRLYSGEIDDITQARLKTMIAENKVLLFMKGNKLFPQCGFSNTGSKFIFKSCFIPIYDTTVIFSACMILDAIGSLILYYVLNH